MGFGLARRSTGQRIAVGLVCSLLFHGLSPRPVQAAQELVVRLDGMELLSLSMIWAAGFAMTGRHFPNWESG